MIKKQKNKRIKIHDKLFEIIRKRQKLKKELEKKIDEKEGEMCTFSPKINKNNFLNLNYSFKPQYYNIPPIIIFPSTSRVYFPKGTDKNIKFGEILQNFIGKSSSIISERSKRNKIIEKNDCIENVDFSNYIYGYSRKNIHNKNDKNTSTLDGKYTNTKHILYEEEKHNPINEDYYRTFRGKRTYNNLFNFHNINHKTNSFLKKNSAKKKFKHLHDIVIQVPKKIKANQKFYLNEKINKIYLNNFSKSNYKKNEIINSRKIQLIKQKQKQRLNTLNTNNETKGCSASTLSTRDIQNIRTNSKRDNNSNISNYTINYKTKSIMRKNKVNKFNYVRNENNMTLQSLSDSKLLDLAEHFIDNKDKDEFLDDVVIKKMIVINNNRNRNKNITFSGEK